MKSFFKHSLEIAVLLGLTACSGSKSSQALNDFSYLETQQLRQWQTPADRPMLVSNVYAIPSGDFSGELGSSVSILPPVQILKIVSPARYESSPFQAVFLLPKNSDEEHMDALIRLLIQKEIIPFQNKNQNGIETGWIKLDDEKEGIQVRYQLTPLEQNEEHGIQVTLLEAKRDMVNFTPSDAESERYNVVMANRLLLEFDIYMRERANQAQGNLTNIPLELGVDRSGNVVIIARSSYNPFWDKLPSILSPLGFTVQERNRSQGSIELDHTKPDASLWQSLGVSPLQLDNAIYKMQLGDLGNRTSINLLNNLGKPVSEEVLRDLSDALVAVMAAEDG